MLSIGNLHREEISLLVLEGSTVDIILGRPWLEIHAPTDSWYTEEVTKWSEYCFNHYIPQKTSSSQPPEFTVSRNSTTIESPEVQSTVSVPEEYGAFQDVFSKQLATKLPPHQP